MKNSLTFIILIVFIASCSEEKSSSKIRPLLKEQLKYSHFEENWFVPTKIAINGLKPEQVNWKDSTQNHSIGELVSHLTYWNDVYLRALKGEDVSDFDIDNDTTFLIYTEKEWKNVTSKLDSVQMEFDNWAENATEEQLSEEAPNILTMVSHNASHSGQIIYIRKQNGWWNRKQAQ